MKHIAWGVGCLVAAVLVLAGTVVWVLGHHPFAEDEHVLPNGVVHRVAVEPGRTTVIWVWAGWAEHPDCFVVDAASGEPVETVAAPGRYEVGGAGAAPWIDHRQFTPRSDAVLVTCKVTDPDLRQADVAVHAKPWLPWWLEPGLWVFGPPLVLALLGAVLLVRGIWSLLTQDRGRREPTPV